MADEYNIERLQALVEEWKNEAANWRSEAELDNKVKQRYRAALETVRENLPPNPAPGSRMEFIALTVSEALNREQGDE